MSDEQFSIFVIAVVRVVERNLMAIVEAAFRFVERNAVLVAIDFSFEPVPGEFHVTRPAAPSEAVTDASVTVLPRRQVSEKLVRTCNFANSAADVDCVSSLQK